MPTTAARAAAQGYGVLKAASTNSNAASPIALLYAYGKLLGALGVSGDTSCADHNIAWKLRHELELDYVPAGVNEIKGKIHATDDNIVYDDVAWAHPVCSDKSREVAEKFYKTRPTRPFPGNHVRRDP